MKYIKIDQLIAAHADLIQEYGGAAGVRDRGLLESAVAQPQMGFGGQEFYVELHEKAAALSYSLICNHPFFDGNKRIGFASAELMLRLNGSKMVATVDEAEQVTLAVASGQMSRDDYTEWIRGHIQPLPARNSDD